MTTKSNEQELVGYVRRSAKGTKLKLNISTMAFAEAKRYISQDGHEYVALVVDIERLKAVLSGERVVTSVVQEVRE